jgi:hypothetical protein
MTSYLIYKPRGFFHLFKLKDQCISYKDYNITFEEFDILEVHTLEILPVFAVGILVYPFS